MGRSKLSQSLVPTEKQSVGRSVIERLATLKGEVINYNLYMSLNTKGIFSLTAHYCTGPERKNTHIGMTCTTATDGVSLSLSVMEVVENFGLEENIVGIASDGGGNILVCRESLESKYTNEYVFPPPNPLFSME